MGESSSQTAKKTAALRNCERGENVHVNDNEGAKGEEDAQEGDAPGGHHGEVQVRGIGEKVEVDAE